jgi:hypothetical protein
MTIAEIRAYEAAVADGALGLAEEPTEAYRRAAGTTIRGEPPPAGAERIFALWGRSPFPLRLDELAGPGHRRCPADAGPVPRHARPETLA